MLNLLNRARIIAGPGFSRWWVPPAALCIHLCIGQIYAYSVFNSPLNTLIASAGPHEIVDGKIQPAPDDWTLAQLGWIFSIALFFLGASAAVFGKWVERSGPRKVMFVSALCFSGGFFLSALGVQMHRLELLYLGNGVLGGIGLGLGYISPVSTLIKWFPDKPGMATGMAIMGFGGGAMIASPLSVSLMNHFKTPTSQGVVETFLVMGILYLLVMMLGAFLVRVPPDNWKPAHFDPSRVKQGKLITTTHVLADNAIKTPQFYLLFGVLMLNVTAGIGVLGQASVMIQEMFSATAVGSENAVDATKAAGFVMLLSFFNMGGRFAWSSLSDFIGRKATYTIFFALGCLLYCTVPFAGRSGNLWLFGATMCLIMSMYGGGFATIPAYLRDLFGTKQVGAIHGRLLLAWSCAAILGPVLVNYIRQYQIQTLGIPKAQAYSVTMYIMSGLLVIGFVLNRLVKPVDPRYSEEGKI